MRITLAAVTAVTGLVIAGEAGAAEKNYRSNCIATKGTGTGSANFTYDDVAGTMYPFGESRS